MCNHLLVYDVQTAYWYGSLDALGSDFTFIGSNGKFIVEECNRIEDNSPIVLLSRILWIKDKKAVVKFSQGNSGFDFEL